MLIKIICCLFAVLVINAMLVVGCDNSYAGAGEAGPIKQKEPVSFSEKVILILQRHECSSCYDGETEPRDTAVEGLPDEGDHSIGTFPMDAEY